MSSGLRCLPVRGMGEPDPGMRCQFAPSVGNANNVAFLLLSR